MDTYPDHQGHLILARFLLKAVVVYKQSLINRATCGMQSNIVGWSLCEVLLLLSLDTALTTRKMLLTPPNLQCT